MRLNRSELCEQQWYVALANYNACKRQKKWLNVDAECSDDFTPVKMHTRMFWIKIKEMVGFRLVKRFNEQKLYMTTWQPIHLNPIISFIFDWTLIVSKTQHTFLHLNWVPWIYHWFLFTLLNWNIKHWILLLLNFIVKGKDANKMTIANVKSTKPSWNSIHSLIYWVLFSFYFTNPKFDTHAHKPKKKTFFLLSTHTSTKLKRNELCMIVFNQFHVVN